MKFEGTQLVQRHDGEDDKPFWDERELTSRVALKIALDALSNSYGNPLYDVWKTLDDLARKAPVPDSIEVEHAVTVTAKQPPAETFDGAGDAWRTVLRKFV